MGLVEKLLAFIAKHQAGCWVYVDFDDPESRGFYVLGGVVPIDKNWFVYYPPWPEDQQHEHDCLGTNFNFTDQQVSFKDQFGRKIVVTPLEPYEIDEIKDYKAWVKEMAKSQAIKNWLDDVVQYRKANPANYLGGHWVGE